MRCLLHGGNNQNSRTRTPDIINCVKCQKMTGMLLFLTANSKSDIATAATMLILSQKVSNPEKDWIDLIGQIP